MTEQISPAELSIILSVLDDVIQRNVEGSVVEFGCYEGATTLHLRRQLLARREPREVHAYDSFEGLPPKSVHDVSPAGEQFVAGELKATRQVLIKHFKQAGLPLPVIHKGWFNGLTEQDVPAHIAFAFLDGDFHESITDSLRLVWPRLSPGAVIVVDDYQSEALPGARRAVDAWLADHPAKLQVRSSLAIIWP